MTILTTDGSEGGYFDPESIAWSPDSQKIAVYRVRMGRGASARQRTEDLERFMTLRNGAP